MRSNPCCFLLVGCFQNQVSLKLVEAFGYTLGGYYLAHYDDSPAGAFDELVVMAGLVWDPPASCAWARRVLVNSTDAARHGIETCGLPSARAHFEPRGATTKAWWDADTPGVLRVTSRDGPDRGKTTELPVPALKRKAGKPAPEIALNMPSFSGNTRACPDLLKYALELKARVHVFGGAGGLDAVRGDLHPAFLNGKPLVTMLFDRLDMRVEAPQVVKQRRGGGREDEEQALPAGVPAPFARVARHGRPRTEVNDRAQ